MLHLQNSKFRNSTNACDTANSLVFLQQVTGILLHRKFNYHREKNSIWRVLDHIKYITV